MVLAAYTRAQATSALIVGIICGVGFALMKLPNAAMFGIVAGLLEMIPIAGPLAVAISATAGRRLAVTGAAGARLPRRVTRPAGLHRSTRG